MPAAELEHPSAPLFEQRYSPYDERSFVGQDFVLQGITTYVKNLPRNPSRLMHIVGPPGSGKTWLLAHLETILPRQTEELRIFRITTDEFLSSAETKRITLIESHSIAYPDIDQFVQRIRSDSVFVLIIDDLDWLLTAENGEKEERGKEKERKGEKGDSNQEDKKNRLRELEREIIKPWIAGGDTKEGGRRSLIITSGLLPRPWFDSSVAYKTDEYILQPFSQEDTVAQVARLGNSQAIAELIQRYSFGNPAVTAALVNKLQRRLSCEATPAEIIEAELEGDLGKEIKDWVLGKIPDELKEKIVALASFRGFNAGTLSDLFGIKTRAALDLIELMSKAGLVDWDIQGGYCMAHATRQVLNKLGKLQQPKIHRANHQKALAYYQRRIEENPYDCGSYITETIYQLATLGRQKETEDFLDKVLVTQYFPTKGAGWLVRWFEEDTEIQQILDHQLIEQLKQKFAEFEKTVETYRSNNQS